MDKAMKTADRDRLDLETPRYQLPEPMCLLIRQIYGLNIGPRRLQKLRLTQDGPPYARDGHDVLYHVEGTLAWAERKLEATLAASTSEESARGQALPGRPKAGDRRPGNQAQNTSALKVGKGPRAPPA
jgi:hypothetical protein